MFCIGRGADAGRRFHIDRGTDNEFAFLVFDIAGYRPAGFGSATLCMNEQGGGSMQTTEAAEVAVS